ncbi:glycosyltransferase [Halosegnis marinus]|uniref:Glycosyltransferase n=1 Tax=Halosegnis marinus TaxID=3034023 RepID=A0ABD5ZQN2_9EURY|nr:glycosyltransferase [Halosegnis sp. DT85]
MPPAVAAFTDTFLPTVNGVTYTVESWRDRWVRRGGRMPVVYPDSPHDPGEGEFPVRSLTFPFYEGFYAGLPTVPSGLGDLDAVHAHTPFSLGLAARRLARKRDLPLVASYHTPTAEYADYLAKGPLASVVESVAGRYERWYLNRADAVVVPSAPTRDHLRELGVEAPVEVVPNGVDTERFAPVGEDERAAFRERHGLPEGPLVGYTGRHGYEKDLDAILDAATGLDATVVFGGDGPARSGLEARAEGMAADVRFLGFLDREELPAFYATLDVFAFPSPVETQGLVALEANACGTPVVGVDAGALAETVVEGETGYHYPRGDTDAFRAGIERALDERERLRESCLATREDVAMEAAVDTLAAVYEKVV